jgi:hypothetical protein
MAGTRGTNTMAEALQKMLADTSYMKTLPDADLEWIINLETEIVSKLREPLERANQGGSMMPTDSMMPLPQQMSGGGAMASAPPMGVPGVQSSAGTPPPDELRRILGQ